MTVSHTLENGKVTICMDKEYSLGLMVVNTKVNTNTIRSMALVVTYSPMAGSMKDSGRMVCSMVSEFIKMLWATKGKESIRMVNV
jgi:hypothetical protein